MKKQLSKDAARYREEVAIKARHQKEVEIKKTAALEKALKEQIASRPTEEQLAAIDELVADGQRKGLSITRELVLYAMRRGGSHGN